MGSLWMPIASPIWNNATGWWFVIFSNDPNLVHGKASVACQNGGNHLHQGPNLGEWWLQEQEQDSAKNTVFIIFPTFQTWDNIYNIRRCRLRSCWCSCCICTIAPTQDPTDHIPKKSTLLKHVGQSFSDLSSSTKLDGNLVISLRGRQEQDAGKQAVHRHVGKGHLDLPGPTEGVKNASLAVPFVKPSWWHRC